MGETPHHTEERATCYLPQKGPLGTTKSLADRNRATIPAETDGKVLSLRPQVLVVQLLELRDSCGAFA